MTVLVFESNLMWSSRLVQSLRARGHLAVLKKAWDGEVAGAEAAIVNLGDSAYDPAELVAELKAHGVRVIAHAGHREKDLIALGKSAGADVLASNRELTVKLEALLSTR